MILDLCNEVELLWILLRAVPHFYRGVGHHVRDVAINMHILLRTPSAASIMDHFNVALGLFQLFPPPDDTFGGVSGRDSIYQAAGSTMDATLGLLFFVGLCNISFPGRKINTERTNFLHTLTTRNGGRVKPVNSISITFRHKIMALMSRKVRKGQLFLLPRDTYISSDPQSSLAAQRVRVFQLYVYATMLMKYTCRGEPILHPNRLQSLYGLRQISARSAFHT